MNDKAKHTPHKWRFTDGGIIDNSPPKGMKGTEIADVYGVDCEWDKRGPVSIVEATANAKLIAAAPDLLEALESLKVPRGRGENGAVLGGWCFCRCVNKAHDETMPRHHPICSRAQAVIKSATS